MLDAKLVIVAGADGAVEYKLSLPTTIGRSRENDVELPHPLVSRRHCELVELDGRLLVRDLGSLNGTFVGNKPTDGLTDIAPGQLLTIGTVTFRAIYANFDSSVLDAEMDDDQDTDVTASTSNGKKFDTDAGTTMIARRKPVAGDAAAGSSKAADTISLDQTVPALNTTVRAPKNKKLRRK